MTVAKHQHGHGLAARGTQATEQARDPVCGMTVNPATSKYNVEHGGALHHFCSAGCAANFSGDPAKYLKPGEAAPKPPAPKGTIYTCPMHPEVR